eukprot:g56630.t1
MPLDPGDNDPTAFKVMYGIVCLNTLLVLVFPALFYKHRRSFPINGRTIILSVFMAIIILVVCIYGHLQVLLPSPGIPCALSLLVVSLVQNLTGATLLFSAWSLYFRGQLNTELEQFRQRLTKIPKSTKKYITPHVRQRLSSLIPNLLAQQTQQKDQAQDGQTVPQLAWRKPISTWYQRHRRMVYPSTFYMYVGFIASLSVGVWVLVLATTPSIQDNPGACGDSTKFAWGLAILAVQGVCLIFLGYRLAGQERDNYGLKKEMVSIGLCYIVLVLTWMVITFNDSDQSDYYSVHSLMLYLGFLVILLLSFVEPVIVCLRMKMQLSAARLKKHTRGEMDLLYLLQGNNQVLTGAFIDFLAKEFSLENYLFWRDVQEIVMLAQRGPLPERQSASKAAGRSPALPKPASNRLLLPGGSETLQSRGHSRGRLSIGGINIPLPLGGGDSQKTRESNKRLSIFPTLSSPEPQLVPRYPAALVDTNTRPNLIPLHLPSDSSTTTIVEVVDAPERIRNARIMGSEPRDSTRDSELGPNEIESPRNFLPSPRLPLSNSDLSTNSPSGASRQVFFSYNNHNFAQNKSSSDNSPSPHSPSTAHDNLHKRSSSNASQHTRTSSGSSTLSIGGLRASNPAGQASPRQRRHSAFHQISQVIKRDKEAKPSPEAVAAHRKQIIAEILRVNRTYVQQDAEREVNLPGVLKDKIKHTMDELEAVIKENGGGVRVIQASVSDTDPDVPRVSGEEDDEYIKRLCLCMAKAKAALIYAQKNCYHLMQTDSYGRFVRLLNTDGLLAKLEKAAAEELALTGTLGVPHKLNLKKEGLTLMKKPAGNFLFDPTAPLVGVDKMRDSKTEFNNGDVGGLNSSIDSKTDIFIDVSVADPPSLPGSGKASPAHSPALAPRLGPGRFDSDLTLSPLSSFPEGTYMRPGTDAHVYEASPEPNASPQPNSNSFNDSYTPEAIKKPLPLDQAAVREERNSLVLDGPVAFGDAPGERDHVETGVIRAPGNNIAMDESHQEVDHEVDVC